MKRSLIRFVLSSIVAVTLVLAAKARAAAPYGRYIPASGLSGWVLDTATGLKWDQTLSSSTYMWCCSTPATWCAQRGGAARVPTKKELESLVDFTASSPAIDTVTFGAGNNVTVVSVSKVYPPGSSGLYWGVNFVDGQTVQVGIASPAYVRCVQ